MTLHAYFIDDEDRLDIILDGNLDFSVARDIHRICKNAPAHLRSCIFDLSSVDRVFDSGVALLQLLYRRLSKCGTTVVVLTDRPEIATRLPATRY